MHSVTLQTQFPLFIPSTAPPRRVPSLPLFIFRPRPLRLPSLLNLDLQMILPRWSLPSVPRQRNLLPLKWRVLGDSCGTLVAFHGLLRLVSQMSTFPGKVIGGGTAVNGTPKHLRAGIPHETREPWTYFQVHRLLYLRAVFHTISRTCLLQLQDLMS